MKSFRNGLFRSSFPRLVILFFLLVTIPAFLLSSSDKRDHELLYPGPAANSFRFLVIGDTQNPVRDPKNQKARKAIFREFKNFLESDEGFILHVGDFVDKGHDPWQWGVYFDDIFWNLLGNGERQRFFPTLGNHEYKTHLLDWGGGDLAPYYERFPHLEKSRYYFFRFGESVFVMMNSGQNGIRQLFGERWENDLEEQIAWLNQTVFPYLTTLSDSVRNVFVGFHKPAYPNPVLLRNSNSEEVLSAFGRFNQSIDNRFRITCFAGHIHTFSHIQHKAPADSGRVLDRFTIGTGGGKQRGRKYFKNIQSIDDLDLYRKARYEKEKNGSGSDKAAFDDVRLDNKIFGYLEVSVRDSLTFTFLRYDETSDSFAVEYTFSK